MLNRIELLGTSAFIFSYYMQDYSYPWDMCAIKITHLQSGVLTFAQAT